MEYSNNKNLHFYRAYFPFEHAESRKDAKPYSRLNRVLEKHEVWWRKKCTAVRLAMPVPIRLGRTAPSETGSRTGVSVQRHTGKTCREKEEGVGQRLH